MGPFDMFTRKKNNELNFAEKLDVLHRALSSGASAHEAFNQAGLTARHYGATLFHAKAHSQQSYDPCRQAVFRETP